MLDDDGGVFMPGLLAAAASTDLNINGSNELHSVTSSLRFKKAVRGLELDSNKLLELPVRTFEWRAGTAQPNETDFGLVAEEVYAVLPELVNLDANGTPYSIRTQPTLFLLLAQVQKLNARIAELEAV